MTNKPLVATGEDDGVQAKGQDREENDPIIENANPKDRDAMERVANANAARLLRTYQKRKKTRYG
jgi:hypothetical protein